MKPTSLANPWLRVVDHVPHATGLALLLAGTTLAPALVPLGWTALALALFAWLAEVEGFAVPRPGRRPIVTYGCWDVPLAFVVRHEGRWLLLSREEDPVDGGWAREYTVYPAGDLAALGLRATRGSALQPERAATPLGRVPVAALAFEHRERASYVVTASLARALHAAG